MFYVNKVRQNKVIIVHWSRITTEKLNDEWTVQKIQTKHFKVRIRGRESIYTERYVKEKKEKKETKEMFNGKKK